MPRFTAILLDLDGTLVDSSDAIAAGITEMARARGLREPTLDWARGRIGYDPRDTWRQLGAADPAALAAEFGSWITDRMVAGTTVLPGAAEALATLAARGHRLAVVTTRRTENAVGSLRATGLDRHVEVVIGVDLVAHPKPAPDPILAALERLSTTADDALMVGDTDADVGAAKAAGLPCWAVLGGTCDAQTLRAAGADLILERGVADLPSALDAAATTGG